MRNVVNDAHGEVPLRVCIGDVIQHRLDHCGCELLGREAVPPTNNHRHGRIGSGRFAKSGNHVHVEGFARGPRLLGAIQHRHGLHCGRQGGAEPSGIEGPVEPHLDQAHLLALLNQVLHGLLRGLAPGAHEHHHPLGIRGADVVEEAVLPSHQGAELVHDVLDNLGTGKVVGIARLARLEVDVRIHRRTAQDRPLWRHAASAMGANILGINHGPDVVIREALDLLHLVAGAEAIEDVEEGYACFQRGSLRDEREILRLLNRVGEEHSPSGGPAGHHIAVIAEDGETGSRNGARRDMEYRAGELPGDLEHVGNHQQEALAGREGCGQRTCLERTVTRSGSASLTLHLLHVGNQPPDIALTRRSQRVRHLAHGRGWRDWIDCNDFVCLERDVTGCFVPINGYEFA